MNNIFNAIKNKLLNYAAQQKQISNLKKEFFKPSSIPARQRVRNAANSQTPYGKPLPIASSETGYNQLDLPSPATVYNYRMRNRLGPSIALNKQNIGSFGKLNPLTQGADIKQFAPNWQKAIERRMKKRPLNYMEVL